MGRMKRENPAYSLLSHKMGCQEHSATALSCLVLRDADCTSWWKWAAFGLWPFSLFFGTWQCQVHWKGTVLWKGRELTKALWLAGPGIVIPNLPWATILWPSKAKENNVSISARMEAFDCSSGHYIECENKDRTTDRHLEMQADFKLPEHENNPLFQDSDISIL